MICKYPFLAVTRADLRESLRSRWFVLYSCLFAALFLIIFATGTADSRVLGFTGLSRLLLIFIQSCNIILPAFILVTTVRSIAKDRQSHVLEYMLSFPINLTDYYFGKFLGRLIAVSTPLVLTMFLAVILSFIKGGEGLVTAAFYTALLLFSAYAFLGIAFFISSVCTTEETALGAALFVWLTLTAFMDIVLIGFMINMRLPPPLIFSVALLNPVQVFRIAALALFDPVLSVLGPASYFILDHMGRLGFSFYSVGYLAFIGTLAAILGNLIFNRKDLY